MAVEGEGAQVVPVAKDVPGLEAQNPMLRVDETVLMVEMALMGETDLPAKLVHIVTSRSIH